MEKPNQEFYDRIEMAKPIGNLLNTDSLGDLVTAAYAIDSIQDDATKGALYAGVAIGLANYAERQKVGGDASEMVKQVIEGIKGKATGYFEK